MSHRVVRIFCRPSCLQGCAVNLFNETIQVKSSPPKRRWGKGRNTKYKKFYFLSFHRCYKSAGKSVAFFFPFCLVSLKNHQPLHWNGLQEPLRQEQFLAENNKKLVDARLNSCVSGCWIQLKSCKWNQSSFLNEIYENKESQCLNNLSHLYQCCLSNYSVCSMVWQGNMTKSIYQAD